MSLSLPISWSRAEANETKSVVSPEKLSNYDLIVCCQAGSQPDKVAFSELLRRYQSHLNRLFYHLAPDWQERADLAQEVWIRVYRNIHRLQDPAKFRGWLSRIATNLFYDELRKRKRISPPLSLDAPRYVEDGEMSWELPDNAPGPNDDLATREFYEHLQTAIADLPETFRTTIVLREIEGLPYEEIAEIMECPIGTVRSRIFRARDAIDQQLRPLLDNTGKA